MYSRKQHLRPERKTKRQRAGSCCTSSTVAAAAPAPATAAAAPAPATAPAAPTSAAAPAPAPAAAAAADGRPDLLCDSSRRCSRACEKIFLPRDAGTESSTITSSALPSSSPPRSAPEPDRGARSFPDGFSITWPSGACRSDALFLPALVLGMPAAVHWLAGRAGGRYCFSLSLLHAAATYPAKRLVCWGWAGSEFYLRVKVLPRCWAICRRVTVGSWDVGQDVP